MTQRSLTEGPISRGMVHFALPILYANVLQSLNASVNSIWVGRYLGEAAGGHRAWMSPPQTRRAESLLRG